MGWFNWNTLNCSGGKHISLITIYIVFESDVSLVLIKIYWKQQYTKLIKTPNQHNHDKSSIVGLA